MPSDKPGWGGKRPGAGNTRKLPPDSPTFCIRVPAALHAALTAANPDEIRRRLAEWLSVPHSTKEP